MREDLGKLLLRVAVGGLMLFHGIAKITHGIGPIGEMLSGKGLPSAIAYGVYLGEVVGSIMVLLGFLTRVGGLLIAIDMVFALFLVHMGQLGQINPQSGGYALEVQFLFLLGGLSIFCLGGGRYSVGGKMA